MAVDAAIGDTLVLVFNLRDSVVDAARIRSDDTLERRLRLLLGRSASKPIDALALGLECPSGEVLAALRQRGDKDLADLLHRDLAVADYC